MDTSLLRLCEIWPLVHLVI